MENRTFINDFITKAINDYIDYKYSPDGVNFNSFYAVVFRLLVLIYSEEDLLNAYYLYSKDEFINVLKKFGYENSDAFIECLNNYYNNENSEGFIFIQKSLVDMLYQKEKRTSISLDDKKNFKSLLYSPYSSNPLQVAYNFSMSKNPLEVINYYESFENENVITPNDEVVPTLETLNSKKLQHSFGYINIVFILIIIFVLIGLIALITVLFL